MATTLGVKTVFTAVDRFSAIVGKMGAAVSSFASKASTAFARVERAERKMRGAISNAIGKFGQLGLAISGIAIATSILAANVELDKNLASLASITGVSAEQFKVFQIEIERVSKAQKMFAGDTAKAFEIVGSVRPELLGNADALAKVTEAAITLSKATGMDLQLSAENLVGTMNQFNLGANESARIMNVLAAGSLEGSAPVDKITESLTQFGAVANSAGVGIESSVALIEQLGAKSIYGSEAGNKLKNVLLAMSTAKGLDKKALDDFKRLGVNLDIVTNNSLPLTDRLREMSKITNDALAPLHVFGKENIVAGQIILQNVDNIGLLTEKMTGTNVANTQAAIMTNTLSTKWQELVNSFKNAVTSTNSENEALNKTKLVLSWVADNMEQLIKVVSIGLITYGAFRVLMLGINIAMAVYNGILWLTSAATWATLFPMLIIVVIIAAIIAVIVLLIVYWQDMIKWLKESDSWFAKLIRFAIYPLIILFQGLGVLVDWLSEKWNNLMVLLEPIINQFSILGEVISLLWDNITSLIEGAIKPLMDAFGPLGDIIDFFSEKTQTELGVDVNKNTTNTIKTLNPDAAKQNNTNSNMQSILSSIGININDKTGQASISENKNGIPINLTKNLGWQ